MVLSKEEKDMLVKELLIELHAKLDGTGRNIIVPECIWCGKGGGKMGVYVGPETATKKPFMAHCFKCGHSTRTLEQLLSDIGRMDLMPTETFDLESQAPIDDFSFFGEEKQIDDTLEVVEMPNHYRRTYHNKYLDSRGFTEEDYEFFQVGTTRGLNFKFDDYVLFPIFDDGDIVGYIGRNTASKEEIDKYNETAKRLGKYQILRYRNSVENEFSKLLYNYDSVIEDVTDTVVIVEGVFDAIALTRKLNWYDNRQIAAVATFGKKISDTQMYKLQKKGVRTVVVGYDGDAVETIKKVSDTLSEYFNVYIADVYNPEADFDSMDFWDVYDTFAYNLKTPVQYKLNKIQL